MSESPATPLTRPRVSSVLPAEACQAASPPDFDAELAGPHELGTERVSPGDTGAGTPLDRELVPMRTGEPECRSGEGTRRQREAAEIAQEMERRAAEVEREAYLKGFQQGEAAGLEMGQAKLAPLLRDLDAVLAQLTRAREEVVRANQAQLVELALAIAARILHREIEQSTDQILQTVEEVLSLVGAGDRVRLRLSQADFQNLLDHQGELPALAHLGDRVTLEVDPAMIRGGCLVLTETGSVDATIETMFDEMRQALTGKLLPPAGPAGDAP